MSVPLDFVPTDGQIATMRREIAATIETRKHRRRVTWALAGAGSALVIAGATTAAAIYVNAAPTDALNTSFDCYTTTDLSAPHATTVWVDDGHQTTRLIPMAERVQQAIDSCVTGWTAIPTGSVKVDIPNVPNPTACELRDGRLAVLPNADGADVGTFCAALGLVAPQE